MTGTVSDQLTVEVARSVPIVCRLAVDDLDTLKRILVTYSFLDMLTFLSDKDIDVFLGLIQDSEPSKTRRLSVSKDDKWSIYDSIIGGWVLEELAEAWALRYQVSDNELTLVHLSEEAFSEVADLYNVVLRHPFLGTGSVKYQRTDKPPLPMGNPLWANNFNYYLFIYFHKLQKFGMLTDFSSFVSVGASLHTTDNKGFIAVRTLFTYIKHLYRDMRLIDNTKLLDILQFVSVAL